MWLVLADLLAADAWISAASVHTAIATGIKNSAAGANRTFWQRLASRPRQNRPDSRDSMTRLATLVNAPKIAD